MSTSQPLTASKARRSSTATLPVLVTLHVIVPASEDVASVMRSRRASRRGSSATSMVTSSRRSKPSPLRTMEKDGSVLAARDGGSTTSQPTMRNSPFGTSPGASHDPNRPGSRSSCTEGVQAASPALPTNHSNRRVSPVGWLPDPKGVVYSEPSSSSRRLKSSVGSGSCLTSSGDVQVNRP